MTQFGIEIEVNAYKKKKPLDKAITENRIIMKMCLGGKWGFSIGKYLYSVCVYCFLLWNEYLISKGCLKGRGNDFLEKVIKCDNKFGFLK